MGKRFPFPLWSFLSSAVTLLLCAMLVTPEAPALFLAVLGYFSPSLIVQLGALRS